MKKFIIPVASVIFCTAASALSIDLAPSVNESTVTLTDSDFSKYSSLTHDVNSFALQIGLSEQLSLHKHFAIGARAWAGKGFHKETLYASGDDHVTLDMGYRVGAGIAPTFKMTKDFSVNLMGGYALNQLKINDDDRVNALDAKLHGFVYGVGMTAKINSQFDASINYEAFAPKSTHIASSVDTVSLKAKQLSLAIRYKIA